MKILAFILIIFGISKILFTLSLKVTDLYPLAHAYRLNPDTIYKQLNCLLIGEGILSTIIGLFVTFLT